MKIIYAFSLLVLCVFFCPTQALAQKSPIYYDVFTAGLEGYHTFRIPSLVSTNNGTLLAFCEGRESNHDHAENDIVLKRSFDHGKSWTPLQVVKEDGGNSLNDPCVVVLESGRILMTYIRFPKGVHARNSSHTIIAEEGYDGPKNTRTYLTYSDDDGVSWSPSKDITRQLRRSNAISIGSPGRAIQLKSGKFKGRIIFPFYQTRHLGAGKRNWDDYVAFSDDQGENWQRGDVVADHAKGFANEAQIVELSNGDILMNSRNQGGNGYRKSAISKDGGMSWSVFKEETTLIDPTCMGSIIRYRNPEKDSPGILVFSNPAHHSKRINGTLHVSYDDGQTWPIAKKFVNDDFMYSCLSVCSNGNLACLYETDNSMETTNRVKRIRIAIFDKKWVEK